MEDQAKARVVRAIDARRDEIVGVARQIASHPELGFKEVRTAALVADRLAGLGLVAQTGLAVTGVKAVLQGGGGPGPGGFASGRHESAQRPGT